MRNQHRFTAVASLDAVTVFRLRAYTYLRATSPPLIMKYGTTPELHNQGGEIAFTTWVSSFPIYCDARIEDVSTEGVRTGDQRERTATVPYDLRPIADR